MASPTVELALSGSFLAQVLAETNGVYWRMFTPDANVIPHTFGTYTTLTTAQSGVLEVFGTVPASSRNLPSQIPDGGYAIALDGASDYLVADNARPSSDPFTAPFSIEVILTLNAVPSGGIEPAIMGNSPFGLTYTNAGNVSAYHNGASFATYAVAATSRVHLVLTRAGTATDSIILYVGGVNRGSTTPARVSFQLDPVYFGVHWTNAHYLNATYEFAAIYPSELTPARVLAHYNALTWTDVTTDTLGGLGLTIERGIRDDKPSNRVASSGSLTFSLNNLGSNSGGVTGYYSPAHASVRAGFTRGIPVRVKTGSDVQFVGRVRAIAPAPGRSGKGVVKVVATDFVDQCALFLMDTVAVMEDVTGDRVCREIVGLMPTQPHGFESATGTETYPLVLDNTRDESVSALAEFHRLAVSELGYIYVNREGTLVYEARGTRIGAQPTSSVTLTDTMVGLDVAEVSADTINRVQITVHPRLVDTAATTVLYATTNPLEIAAGETKTIIGPFRTPTVPGVTTRVGGLSMVAPVATTDYLMNALSDGTGTDLTTALTVTANYGANGVQLVLVSAATQPAFITRLQCRGKGVYDFRTVVVRSQDDADVAAYGVNALTLDMVYQQEPNVAQSLADYLRTAYSDIDGSRVKRVALLPDAPGMPANLLTKDISDRVTVSETITAATGDYYINGVKHEYQNGTLPKVTWWLSPASAQSYWILDLVGASELDSNAILAPA